MVVVAVVVVVVVAAIVVDTAEEMRTNSLQFYIVVNIFIREVSSQTNLILERSILL